MKKYLSQLFTWRTVIVITMMLAISCSPQDDDIPPPVPRPDPPPALPAIRINTLNGATIDSQERWTEMTFFALNDPSDEKNNVQRSNLPSLDRIRGRGNSTWWAGVEHGKKPYRIRFRENVSFFGLPAAENWVLLANWFDATNGIKNAFAFELGARLGVPHTPSFHFVELYLNNEHQGTYILTEHRQVAPAGVTPGPGRVEIHPETGWLVELDFRWDEEEEDPKFRTRRYNLPVAVKGNAGAAFPDGSIITDEDHFVVNDWNHLTDLMYASDFPENGYRELIDMQSIVNFFMIQVLANNHDFNHPGSVFFHKNADGLIAAGPLWDFDLSFGSWHRGMGGTLMGMRYINWLPEANEQAPNVRPFPTFSFFARFLQDPVFREMWRESWKNNRETILSMYDFIDETAEKIRRSTERNYRRWRTAENVNFDWWVSDLRNYFDRRFTFLDEIYSAME